MAVAQQENTQRPTKREENAENGEQSSANSVEDEWDEERLEKAMSTLKEMHIQVSILFGSSLHY